MVAAPALVLVGSYGSATSAIQAPSPMNYLAVHLKAGERWNYQPPAGHTVLWTAVGRGSVLVPDELQQGELVAFRPSSAAIKFEAQSEKNGPTGITRGLTTFIGVAEIAGGLGIVLPMATNIAPSLSLWAAVGLSTIMLLAIGFHLRRHESAVAPGILFLLAAFVVFGRFSHLR